MRRMSKTSIFSSKYEKRQRRKRFFRNFLLFLLLVAALILIFRKPIMEMVEKVKQDIAQEEVQKEEILEQLPETVVNEEVETPSEEPEEEKVYVTAVLPGSEAVSLQVMEENGAKVFSPDLELPLMETDISPAKNQVVILDSTTQNLFLVDIEGNVTDITYKTYVKKDKTYSASKEEIIARYNNEFVWGEQPRFLDEDTVVYMSQLPWFDERRFLYVVELSPLSHRNFQSVFGTDVVLKALSEKGLAFEKEGKTYYLTADFKIIQE